MQYLSIQIVRKTVVDARAVGITVAPDVDPREFKTQPIGSCKADQHSFGSWKPVSVRDIDLAQVRVGLCVLVSLNHSIDDVECRRIVLGIRGITASASDQQDCEKRSDQPFRP